MMTQEEYVDGVLALKRQGKTNKEIGEELGYHPATIAKWLKEGGPPPARTIAPPERVVDARWADRVHQLIQPPAEKLLATSVYDIITAEGFKGSYPSVARYLSELRGPRFRAMTGPSMSIETAPGEEAQFDWSECHAWTERWGLGKVFCLSCILCWSRWRRWWFTTSIDAEHTFEGLVRFFEAAGGIPKVLRTDRMGALGTSQGKRFRLHLPAIDFARWNGVEIKVCQARDAKRKGKVERPFRDTKESFLTELDALGPPKSVGELDSKGEAWVERRRHARVHSTTKERPDDRIEVERRFLSRLPGRRFDTAYREDRRVHPRLALVEWEGVAYSVAPDALGSKVVCRAEVDSGILEIWWGSQRVARHRLRPGATEAVWDPAHREAVEAIALGRTRSTTAMPPPPLAKDREETDQAAPLEMDQWPYDVQGPDLEARYGACGCTGRGM